MHDNRVTRVLEVPLDLAVYINRRMKSVDKTKLKKKRKTERNNRKKNHK